MDYLFTFLEGIASFISPCILPMLPIYVSYFIGQNEKNNKKTVINAIGFVLGFTIIFMLFSILVNTIGLAIKEYIKILEEHGIVDARTQMENMFILDFLIMNEDRHLNNFGIIRDVNTLKWMKCAQYLIMDKASI